MRVERTAKRTGKIMQAFFASIVVFLITAAALVDVPDETVINPCGTTDATIVWGQERCENSTTDQTAVRSEVRTSSQNSEERAGNVVLSTRTAAVTPGSLFAEGKWSWE